MAVYGAYNGSMHI